VDEPVEFRDEPRYDAATKKEYGNDRIAVTWEPAFCIHTANCLRGAPEVFDSWRRPWIDVDKASADEIAEVVTRCPTGALHFRRLDDEPGEEAPTEPVVQLRPNGPLFVHGKVRIEDASGHLVREDTRVALCRCGGSHRKPFCDSTHERIGFDGTETADRRPSDARRDVYPGEGVVMTDDLSLCTLHGFCGDRFTKVWQMIDRTADPEVREKLMRMVDRCPSGRLQYAVPPDPEPFEHDLEPEVAVTPDGPLWVRGGVDIVSDDGTPWETRNRVTLCRCGRSQNKPFCDGSHEAVGFRDDPG